MFDIEFRREQLRKAVARDLANSEIEYCVFLMILQDLNYFGNWTGEEITHRPVDVEEVEEIVYDTYYSKEF